MVGATVGEPGAPPFAGPSTLAGRLEGLGRRCKARRTTFHWPKHPQEPTLGFGTPLQGPAHHSSMAQALSRAELKVWDAVARPGAPLFNGPSTLESRLEGLGRHGRAQRTGFHWPKHPQEPTLGFGTPLQGPAHHSSMAQAPSPAELKVWDAVARPGAPLFNGPSALEARLEGLARRSGAPRTTFHRPRFSSGLSAPGRPGPVPGTISAGPD